MAEEGLSIPTFCHSLTHIQPCSCSACCGQVLFDLFFFFFVHFFNQVKNFLSIFTIMTMNSSSSTIRAGSPVRPIHCAIPSSEEEEEEEGPEWRRRQISETNLPMLLIWQTTKDTKDTCQCCAFQNHLFSFSSHLIIMIRCVCRRILRIFYEGVLWTNLCWFVVLSEWDKPILPGMNKVTEQSCETKSQSFAIALR